MKYILIITFVIFFYPGNSQIISRPLNIGDTFCINFKDVINNSSKSINTASLKGKMVIIDFWATWCSSCINGFSMLDSIQKQFNNEIRILLVDNLPNTSDTKDAVTNFLRKYKQTHPEFSLPLVIENSEQLRASFLFQYVPRYVWLNADGKIIAITSSEELTVANIRKALNNDASGIPERNERYNP